MSYIEFDSTRPIDLIPMGRMAIDFNPVIPPFQSLVEADTFKKYVGGSPANVAVGLARLGKKSASSARFPMISSAITSQNSLTMRVSTPLTSQERRTAKN